MKKNKKVSVLDCNPISLTCTAEKPNNINCKSPSVYDRKYNMKEPPFFEVTNAYSLEMDNLGDPKIASNLWKKFGIMHFEKVDNSHSVCSIGYSPRRKKWYGWSHRAICGFKIGDVVKKGDCTNSSGYVKEYLEAHPELDKSLPIGFKAKTLDDCKRMAIAFAESIS